MINIHKLSIIGFFIFLVGMFSIGQLTAENTSAQDEPYYEEVEESSEVPKYGDPLDEDNFAETQPEPVDPEFMDEVEPGEFDQSDDVTELDDNNY